MNLEQKKELIQDCYYSAVRRCKNSKDDDKTELKKLKNRLSVYCQDSVIARMRFKTFADLVNKYHPTKRVEIVVTVKDKEVQG